MGRFIISTIPLPTARKQRKYGRWFAVFLFFFGIHKFIVSPLLKTHHKNEMNFNSAMDSLKTPIASKGSQNDESLASGISRALASPHLEGSNSLLSGWTAPPAPNENIPELDSERAFALESANNIIQKGASFFADSPNPLGAKEEALNVARTLSFDPTQKYTTQISELAKLILLTPDTETPNDDLSNARGNAANEWALNLFLQTNNDSRIAIDTTIEAINAQNNKAGKDNLRQTFLQARPDLRESLIQQIGEPN